MGKGNPLIPFRKMAEERAKFLSLWKKAGVRAKAPQERP
jgi:hypothetical protein